MTGGAGNRLLLLYGGDSLKILALDQARSGAWSVFDYESKQLLDYGIFDFDAKHYTYAQAVFCIEQLVWDVMQEQEVDAVFLEDIQLRANVQAFKKLAQLQGVLVNLLQKNDYLYDYIAPSKWQNYCMARSRNATERKSNVTSVRADGKKESKVLSLQFVKDHFDIETTNDNLADAICIGWYVVNEVELAVQQRDESGNGKRKGNEIKVINDGKKGKRNLHQ